MGTTRSIKDIKVDAFTSPEPKCISIESSLEDAFKLMQQEGIRHLPVERSQGQVVGILSQRDFANLNRTSDLANFRVEDLMTPDPISVFTGSALLDAAYLLSKNKIGSLIVSDENGKLVGIFTSTDALNALVEVLRDEILSEE